jgi:endonuclease YncB( thermonuclease family)
MVASWANEGVRAWHGLVLAALLATAATQIGAVEVQGKVVAVADGDTITVLDDAKRQHRIRVAAIDAPEKSQAFGSRSKEHLGRLAFGQRVTCDVIKTDAYGRSVANVFASSVDIGLAQIEAGMAWHFKRYASEQSVSARQKYEAAEVSARTARRGLWADKAPVPPWAWRKEQTHRESGLQ